MHYVLRPCAANRYRSTSLPCSYALNEVRMLWTPKSLKCNINIATKSLAVLKVRQKRCSHKFCTLRKPLQKKFSLKNYVSQPIEMIFRVASTTASKGIDNFANIKKKNEKPPSSRWDAVNAGVQVFFIYLHKIIVAPMATRLAPAASFEAIVFVLDWNSFQEGMAKEVRLKEFHYDFEAAFLTCPLFVPPHRIYDQAADTVPDSFIKKRFQYSIRYIISFTVSFLSLN